MSRPSSLTPFARVAEIDVHRHSFQSGAHVISPIRDTVAIEAPLQIRVLQEDQVQPALTTITMRTPGHDKELALGLLFSEGIITSFDDVLTVNTFHQPRTEKQSTQTVDVILKKQVKLEPNLFKQTFPGTSSCGICGRAVLPNLPASHSPPDNSRLKISASLLPQLPQRMVKQQTLFHHTGGIHAAALFTAAGSLIHVAEDIGRHNAMDKLVGQALQDDNLTSMSTSLLLLSGRTSYELIQKAIVAGLRFIVSIGAPSSLAIELAQHYDVTLAGFLNEERFNVYAGQDRINS